MGRYRHHGRSSLLLAGLAAALAAGGCLACADVGRPATATAPADTAAGELAFRLAGPGGAALVVPVYVNGRGPVELILDTGATLTCVDEAFARELGLPERRGTVGAAVGIGGAGRVRLVAVDSLRVGAASARGVTGWTMGLRALRAVGPKVRGLLGLNFLRSFRIALDFEREVLRLTRPGE